MQDFNLQSILRALLISTSESISIKEIQTVVARYHEQREREMLAVGTPEDFDEAGLPVVRNGVPAPEQGEIEQIVNQVPLLLTATQIREAMEILNQTMKDDGEVTRIVSGPEGFRLAIAPEYASWVRLLRDEPKPNRLSTAALETLAIIAYRQPVTRAEMESLRGVSVDTALARLVDLDLVRISGRADSPGRPSQYSTTQKFLDFVGIRTVSELPESDVLSPAQIAEWLQKAMAPQKPKTSADVGLTDDKTLDLPTENEEG
ncbi:MAG: SMC-Scp complex subunit ScpB [Opitutales bacterium]|nr:SMC-Scp complex subunit ScpB [Opitutales bacterium]